MVPIPVKLTLSSCDPFLELMVAIRLTLIKRYVPIQGSKYRISGSYRMGSFHIGYRISGDIGDTRAYRAFMSDTIYNEILIT